MNDVNSKSVITISSSPNIHLRAKKCKKGWHLFLDLQYHKKRIYKYLNIYLQSVQRKSMTALDKESLVIAEGIKAKTIIEMNSDTLLISSKHPADISIIDFFESLYQHRADNDDKSKYKWSGALSHFKDFANKNIRFKDVNVKFLEDYKQYLLSQISQVTAREYFSILNSVFISAIRDEIIQVNPMNKLQKKIPRIPTTRIFLTIEEVKKLSHTDCVYEQTKKAFLFCCFTGLRYSDVKALKWSQIKVEDKKTYLYFTQQKTNSPERMPIAEQALVEMGERGKNNDLVFAMKNKKITNKHLASWTAEAGINKKVTFHVARHTFATLALNIGIELKTVSTLLGHKEIRTTEIYAKIMDKTKDEAIAKMPML